MKKRFKHRRKGQVASACYMPPQNIGASLQKAVSTPCQSASSLQEQFVSFICKKTTSDLLLTPSLMPTSNADYCWLLCLANGPQSSLKSMEPQLDHS